MRIQTMEIVWLIIAGIAGALGAVGVNYALCGTDRKEADPGKEE